MLRLDFPNGGRVRLYGADNPDALRGIYLDDVVAGRIRADAGGAVERGDTAGLGRPPRLRNLHRHAMGRNAFCELWERAKDGPDWFALMLKASASSLIPPEELDAARAEMTADQYAQEFECSFDAAVAGSYYGALPAAGRGGEACCQRALDPALPVHTAWDLGIGDSTAIWFFQQFGLEIHIIDYTRIPASVFSYYVGELELRRGQGLGVRRAYPAA